MKRLIYCCIAFFCCCCIVYFVASFMLKFKSIFFKCLNQAENRAKYFFNTNVGANRILWSRYNIINKFSLSSAFLFCGTVFYSITVKQDKTSVMNASQTKTWVLFQTPWVENEIPKPYKPTLTNASNTVEVSQNYVKLPFIDNQSLVTVDQETKQTQRWDIIKSAFQLNDIKTVEDFRSAVKSYNPDTESMNFDVLQMFINTMKESERDEFFSVTLKNIIKLALQLPQIVTQPIPLLRQKCNSKLYLSQYQISCLLANAFLCTFPDRDSHELYNYQDFSFINLLNDFNDTKVEKLKCLVNYLKRVTKEPPTGIVSFERRYLQDDEKPNWIESNEPLTRFTASALGSIETADGSLQADFANKFVGGGVLNYGALQEEIRFVTNPELITSLLFTQVLLDEEVLIITGAEVFNKHSGYASTFQWAGNIVDTKGRDKEGRKLTKIVAMDAKYFSRNKQQTQFEILNIDRELNKAFCGFMDRSPETEPKVTSIATGNWGCGAFNGDPKLKMAIQLLAASQSKRDLLYFTFGDESLERELNEFYAYLVANNITVRELYTRVKLFGDHKASMPNENLFQFVISSKL